MPHSSTVVVRAILIRIALVVSASVELSCSSTDILGERPIVVAPNNDKADSMSQDDSNDPAAPLGDEPSTSGSSELDSEDSAAHTDSAVQYPNLLMERKNVSISQVNAQLNDAFLQLFFGDPDTEAVFVDVGDGTGYIEDIAHEEVRTDAMAYGMLATVQLNQRDVFDKLWEWTRVNMMFTDGASKGLLRWHCDTEGKSCADSSATDSSGIIATTLLMAESRWADAGRHDYQQDGLDLLHAMIGVEEQDTAAEEGVVNCFDLDEALPREGSDGNQGETPVDYLTPAFYEIWAKRDHDNAELWHRMAKNALSLLSQVAHPITGLLPERVFYDGTPVPEYKDYRLSTSRTLLNLALTQLWFGTQAWAIEQDERLLNFFLDQGVDNYVIEYTTDGEPLANYNTVAHRALVALAAGTSPSSDYDIFLEVLLKEPIPTGKYRYYDGMIYMVSLLVLSGQMTPD